MLSTSWSSFQVPSKLSACKADAHPSESLSLLPALAATLPRGGRAVGYPASTSCPATAPTACASSQRLLLSPAHMVHLSMPVSALGEEGRGQGRGAAMLRHWHVRGSGGKAMVADEGVQSKLRVPELRSPKNVMASHACSVSSLFLTRWLSLFLMQLGFIVIKCFCDLTALSVT